MPRHSAPGPASTGRVPPDSIALSEVDLALVEALQLDPRAPWTRIAGAIGIDATTAARRWERLHSAGLAWLTAYTTTPTTTIGYLDLACRPDALPALTEELCRWPSVFSVERTTGRYQLLLGVTTHDLAALDALVTGRVGELTGVDSTRLAIATKVYREGSGWLVRALAPEQRAVLDDTAAQARALVPGRWNDATVATLLEALSVDGRRSCADLARDCGMSESAVRRVLGRMLRNHELDFRCDLANGLAGWPVIATYRLDVPGDQLDRIARALATRPETRLCVTVTGEHNLILTVWLHAPVECGAFEAQLATAAPEARVVDRVVTIRMPKRMGRLLASNGTAVGQVPIIPART